MSTLAAVLAAPVVQPPRVVDISPRTEAYVLQAVPTTNTTHSVQITVPSGLTSAKLLIKIVAQEDLDTIALGALTPEPYASGDVDDGAGSFLHGYGYFLDQPPIGAQNVDLTFAATCLPIVELVVLSGARAGQPYGTASGTENQSIVDIVPEARFSTCVDLVVGSEAVVWTATYGQVPLASNNNGDLWAASSVKRPLNAVAQKTSWRADAQPSLVMQLAAVVAPSVGLGTDAFRALSSWAMDEATGTQAVDAGGLSPGTWTAPERGVASIVAGGSGSTGLNGSTSHMFAAHVTEWQQPSITVGGVCQIDSLPAVNMHWTLISKDANRPPGGFSVEARNVAGQLRLRAYTRAAGTGGTASAVFIGGSLDGVVDLSIGVAFRWALVLDPTDPTQPTRLLFKRAGGAASVVGSSTNTQGLQDNAAAIYCGQYHDGQSPLPGVLKDYFIGSGAMTLSQFDALPAAVSITHATPVATVTANDDIVAQSTTSADHNVLANDNPPDGVPTGDITITAQPAAGTASVINDGTASAQIRYVRNPLPTSNETQTLRYTVDGSSEAEVTINITGTGGGGNAPFPFVTQVRPAYQSIPRPGFNALDPEAETVTDPMSGLRLWRVLPYQLEAAHASGRLRDRNGNYVDFASKFVCRHHASSSMRVWNADSARLWIDDPASRSADSNSPFPWPSGGVMISRTLGWRIERFGKPFGYCWWDADDPDMMWTHNGSGLYQLFNVVTGVTTNHHQFTGYTFGVNNSLGRASYNQKMVAGRYHGKILRRNSDNALVLTRIDMVAGTKSGDIILPTTQGAAINGGTYSDGTAGRESASGNFLVLHLNGVRYQAFNVPAPGQDLTAAQAFVSEANDPFGLRHSDFAVVNGRDMGYGIGSGNPTNVSEWDIAAGTSRALATIPDGANPNTVSCRNQDDLYETYGVAGGATSGLRYIIAGKSGSQTQGGMWAFRTGPSDTNTLRYLGHPRGAYPGDDNYQCDPVPDRSGRWAVYVSDYALPLGVSQTAVAPYILELPDPGWHNLSNSG